MSEHENQKPGMSRRNFLKNMGLTVGGIAIGGGVTSLFKPESNTKDQVVNAGSQHVHEVVSNDAALTFFKRQEDIDTLLAAIEQIYPTDELGPGAVELGAHIYIDRQLSSQWGINSDEYRKFPIMPFESALNRGDLIIAGLRHLNEVAMAQHEKRFRDLDDEAQIAILTAFQIGEVQAPNFSPPIFFAILRSLTIEGVYCDPMYGGNKNMQAWKMREFPGAQHSYYNEIEQEFKVIPPNSVAGH